MSYLLYYAAFMILFSMYVKYINIYIVSVYAVLRNLVRGVCLEVVGYIVFAP
jgi:hypothetical protein